MIISHVDSDFFRLSYEANEDHNSKASVHQRDDKHEPFPLILMPLESVGSKLEADNISNISACGPDSEQRSSRASARPCTHSSYKTGEVDTLDASNRAKQKAKKKQLLRYVLTLVAHDAHAHEQECLQKERNCEHVSLWETVTDRSCAHLAERVCQEKACVDISEKGCREPRVLLFDHFFRHSPELALHVHKHP